MWYNCYINVKQLAEGEGTSSMFAFIQEVIMKFKKTATLVLIAFLIIGFSMYYSIYKLRGDSIIDTLKEEVL